MHRELNSTWLTTVQISAPAASKTHQTRESPKSDGIRDTEEKGLKCDHAPLRGAFSLSLFGECTHPLAIRKQSCWFPGARRWYSGNRTGSASERSWAQIHEHTRCTHCPRSGLAQSEGRSWCEDFVEGADSISQKKERKKQQQQKVVGFQSRLPPYPNLSQLLLSSTFFESQLTNLTIQTRFKCTSGMES